MTKYEKIYEKIQTLERAMHNAKSESCKNMWFLQAERLKYKLQNSNLTVKEAMLEC